MYVIEQRGDNFSFVCVCVWTSQFMKRKARIISTEKSKVTCVFRYIDVHNSRNWKNVRFIG